MFGLYFSDEFLYEGDIAIDPDEDERFNAFSSIKGGRWPGARIPYEVDKSISKN